MRFDSIKDLLEKTDINSKAAEVLGKAGAFSSIEDMNELEAAEYAKEFVTYRRGLASYKDKLERFTHQKESSQRKYSDLVTSIAEKNKEKTIRYEEKLLEYQEKHRRWEDRLAKNPSSTSKEPGKPVLILKETPPPPSYEEDEPKPPQEPPRQRIALSPRERLRNQRELLNAYISGHPLDEIKVPESSVPIYLVKREDQDAKVLITGILSSLKIINTRKKTLMAKVRVEDKTASIEVVIFPKMWEKLQDQLQVGNIYAISGKVDITKSGGGEAEDDETGQAEVQYAVIVGQKFDLVNIGSDSEWDLKYPLFMGALRVLPGRKGKSRDFASAIIKRSLLRTEG